MLNSVVRVREEDEVGMTKDDFRGILKPRVRCGRRDIMVRRSGRRESIGEEKKGI